MKAYRPDEIQIAPNRQRQEFDGTAMQDLFASIEGKRLFHPIVVRNGTGEQLGNPVLVAGERRLRTIKDIFALGGFFLYDGQRYTETVPTVTLGELDPLEAEEAELDENLKRKDLTWQEHAAAVQRLHKLRHAQIEAQNKHAKVTEQLIVPNHTVADTAREVRGSAEGYNHDVTRKEIIIADHLHKPEVAAAKNIDEAWKVLKKEKQREEFSALAAKVGATFTASLHRLHKANCLDWMRLYTADLSNPRFDVILTDPPYGMGADQFGDGGGKLTGITHQYDDSHESWQRLLGAWTRLSYAICKPQAHAYVFCDIDRFHELKALMEAAGWYVHRTPLIDYKEGSGRVPLPDRGPRRCWEMILYAIKGDKPVTHIYPDVIPCKADENMTHGAQKPVALYQNLLMRSVKPGDAVLDTFAGSGTVFPAAHALQCVATGVEQEETSFGMCLKRVQDLKVAENPLAGLE